MLGDRVKYATKGQEELVEVLKPDEKRALKELDGKFSEKSQLSLM